MQKEANKSTGDETKLAAGVGSGAFLFSILNQQSGCSCGCWHRCPPFAPLFHPSRVQLLAEDKSLLASLHEPWNLACRSRCRPPSAWLCDGPATSLSTLWGLQSQSLLWVAQSAPKKRREDQRNWSRHTRLSGQVVLSLSYWDNKHLWVWLALKHH